jgi:RNase adaptor protein for sRNA GlmZ degradation
MLHNLVNNQMKKMMTTTLTLLLPKSATNTELPNAADIAFDLIVIENPHIHPVQHSHPNNL